MNNRIDLTQEELRDKLYDWMTKGYEPQMAVSDDIPNEISEILFAIDHLGLIAELKRCYEEIDELKSKIEDITLAVENNNIDYLMNCL
jgi:polyhydroxyalkanoate synthesis regulator phasin